MPTSDPSQQPPGEDPSVFFSLSSTGWRQQATPASPATDAQLAGSARRRIPRSTAIVISIATVLAAAAAINTTLRPPTGRGSGAALAAAIVPPDVIVRCPPTDNCLQTETLTRDLTTATRASFADATVTSTASVFDAMIPRVDVQQLVLTTRRGAHAVCTQQRLGRSATAAGPETTSLAGGGLLVARQRDTWLLTVELTAPRGDHVRAIDVHSATGWAESAPVPR